MTLTSYYLDYSFFFNDTATTEIYTLSLHDALPIFAEGKGGAGDRLALLRAARRAAAHQHVPGRCLLRPQPHRDRKSTRLNSSHSQISYAVFCLKKKN